MAHLIDMVVLEAWREATESNPDSRADAAEHIALEASGLARLATANQFLAHPAPDFTHVL